MEFASTIRERGVASENRGPISRRSRSEVDRGYADVLFSESIDDSRSDPAGIDRRVTTFDSITPHSVDKSSGRLHKIFASPRFDRDKSTRFVEDDEDVRVAAHTRDVETDSTRFANSRFRVLRRLDFRYGDKRIGSRGGETSENARRPKRGVLSFARTNLFDPSVRNRSRYDRLVVSRNVRML